MDTGTVLSIIEMIDSKISNLSNEYDEGMNDVEYYSRAGELSDLSKHLQSFIENQLNVVENQTGE